MVIAAFGGRTAKKYSEVGEILLELKALSESYFEDFEDFEEILWACLKWKMENRPITSENVSMIIARSRDWPHGLPSRMVKKGVLTYI
jgi:hypothetical protein